MFENIPWLPQVLMLILAFLVSITVHEFAHARAALWAGDDTAKLMGRVSLNPLDHLDPIGTVMLIVTMFGGIGFGWGKPVPVNPLKFKRPRQDDIVVSLWGPLSNLILAAIISIPMRFGAVVNALDPAYVRLVHITVLMNLGLAFFNLIPVPPLDGSHILSSLLPVDVAKRYDSTVARYGTIILVILLVSGAISSIIGPPITFLYRLLM